MAAAPPLAPTAERRVRIWDAPTRLFHWLIVALFGFSWLTAEIDRLDLHFLSGYAILALLIFRVYWGFAGSATARFASFLKGPRTVFAYARSLAARPGPVSPGHNPMGGWSVAAMLLLLALQVGLGLFAVDVDGLEGGPLSDRVSFETARRIANLHSAAFNFLLALVILHVAFVIFYFAYKRQNLIAAMVRGSKRWPATAPPPSPPFAPIWRALIGIAIAASLTAWIVRGSF
jgi:cytochrome b